MVWEERVAKEVEREGKVVKAVKAERAVEGKGEDRVEAEETNSCRYINQTKHNVQISMYIDVFILFYLYFVKHFCSFYSSWMCTQS